MNIAYYFEQLPEASNIRGAHLTCSVTADPVMATPLAVVVGVGVAGFVGGFVAGAAR